MRDCAFRSFGNITIPEAQIAGTSNAFSFYQRQDVRVSILHGRISVQWRDEVRENRQPLTRSQRLRGCRENWSRLDFSFPWCLWSPNWLLYLTRWSFTLRDRILGGTVGKQMERISICCPRRTCKRTVTRGGTRRFRVNLPFTNHFKHLRDSGGSLSPYNFTIAKKSMYPPVYHGAIISPNAVCEQICIPQSSPVSILGARCAH